MGSQIQYKEPVIVICKNAKHSTKLIQDATYYAMSMNTFRSKQTVHLKNVGVFDSSYFTLTNGTPLNKESDFIVSNSIVLNPTTNNYTGEFVRCRVSTTKSLKLDSIYYVEEQIESKYFSNYNKKYYPTVKLKIKGIDRLLSPYSFKEISLAEQRCIKLKNLNGDKIFNTIQIRKFLQYEEKERISILFTILSKVLIDVTKIINSKDKLNLTKLMIEKGVRYSITSDDINEFLTPEIKNMLLPYNFDF